MTQPPLTDSQVAAIAARDALNDRRYALAEAFARVARIAAQHEAAQAKYDADTARMWAETQAEIQAAEAEVAAAGEKMINSFAAQLDADADATQIGAIPPAVVIPPAAAPVVMDHAEAWRASRQGNQAGQASSTAHCHYGAAYGPCDQAIWLGTDQVWRHIHNTMDHPAVPPHNPSSDMSRG